MTGQKEVLIVGKTARDLAADLPSEQFARTNTDFEDALGRSGFDIFDCLVVSDWEDGEGPAKLQSLREQTALPIVAVCQEPALISSAFGAGATDCLTSATPPALAARISRVVEAATRTNGEGVLQTGPASKIDKQRKQIERLHDVGVELAGCESKAEVWKLMVDACEDILDLDLCIVDSVQDGRLITEATSEELTEYDEPPVDSPEAGIAGKAYRGNDSFLVHDAETHPDAKPSGEYRSGITVPIGKYGVFQAVARDVEVFDRTDLELVEILAEHVREALRRIEQAEKLTKRREALARENERLDEFTSIVSHDLRNPLNVATLRLDLVQDEFESEHLDSIEHALNRMEVLLEDALALALGGEEVSEYEELSLSAVVNAAWRTVDTKNATLECTSQARIHADESRLQQVLENLIRNAIEHAPGEDDPADCSELTITVDTLAGNGFYVADSGVGIPADISESMFEPGTSTETDGTGLGLAIVRRIAEAHGWEIEVTESAEGGVRFEFSNVEFGMPG